MELLLRLVVELLAKASTTTEYAAITFRAITVESTLPFSIITTEASLLRWWRIMAALLCATASRTQSRVTGVFLAILFVVDKVPALGEICSC